MGMVSKTSARGKEMEKGCRLLCDYVDSARFAGIQSWFKTLGLVPPLISTLKRQLENGSLGRWRVMDWMQTDKGSQAGKVLAAHTTATAKYIVSVL